MAALTQAQAQRTLNKLTYGQSKASVAELRSKGLEKWLKDQLNPKKAETNGYLKDLSPFRSANMSVAEIQSNFLFKTKPILLANELSYLTVLRRAYSSRQVFEMLVEHFSDYVPVPLGNKRSPYRGDYDKSVIRANALGYYPDLLVAATYHPAMLQFLNGATNTATQPNENYGREFLELFTITPSAGYKEDDVKNAAKMFSGMGFDSATGASRLRVKQHYFGPISAFGYQDANPLTSNEAVIRGRIDKFIRHFALLPQTARAFSMRMAKRFVADQPSEQLIDLMAAEYLRSNGHIPSVFKAMALSGEFALAPAAKVKRPMEHLASTIRVLDVPLVREIPDPNLETFKDYFKASPLPPIAVALARQGHAPFEWPFPNGYPDHAEPWIALTSQVQRWNLSAKITSKKMPAAFAGVDYSKLVSAASSTPQAILTDLSKHIFGTTLPEAERVQIEAIIAESVKKNANKAKYVADMAALAATLLLARPDWNLR